MYCCCVVWLFFFVKQKTAYERRISDWSSDVCSSDLMAPGMAKCAKTLAKCEIVVSGPGRAAFLEHHLGKLGEVRSSVDRPVIGRLVTAQRFGAAFENLFACENGKEVVHVDEIRLIFQRIGHIIRIGHE